MKKRKMALTVACAATVLWSALSGEAAQTQKAYGQILSESSMRLITEQEIEDMSAQVLSYARNEIYARSGRMFRSAELQNYFGMQTWYTALYQPDQFTSQMLNTYEQQNLELLSDREGQLGLYVLDMAGYSDEEIYDYLDTHEQNLGDFEVDPVSEIFNDSDRRVLTDDDLKSLTLQECHYAWCEICARHGMIFDSRELSDYFGQKNWYAGYVSEALFDDSVLNDIEQTNLEALKEQEAQLDEALYQTDEGRFSYKEIGSYTVGASYAAASDDFVFRDSAIRYLTEEEVSGLSLRMLCYARYEIYARRGVVFTSRELHDRFSSFCWYHPSLTADRLSDSNLNEYELANIALLRSYEYSINAEGYRLY